MIMFGVVLLFIYLFIYFIVLFFPYFILCSLSNFPSLGSLFLPFFTYFLPFYHFSLFLSLVIVLFPVINAHMSPPIQQKSNIPSV